MTMRLRPPPEPPAGVRGQVVSALVLRDDRDFHETALNATEDERRYAAELNSWLAALYSIQAATIGDIAKLLRPWWTDPNSKLMDVLAAAPDDVRARCLRWLGESGLLPDG